MRKLWYVLAIAIMTTLYAGFAAAHSYLVKSSPAADAVVTQAPKEIRLSFNEGIQPRSSTVALTRSDGKKVNTGRASVDPEKGSDLVLAVPSLQPGKYEVRWQATSLDSHRIQGRFAFEVRP